MKPIRWVLADNASPMTLTGTRTYLIGVRQVVVIDAGPNSPAHLDAVADQIGDGVVVAIVSTHTHPDHHAGAHPLAQRLNTLPWSVEDGDEFTTDAGTLRALATPGHTPDHFCFQLVEHGALFCGDLMMGGLDTALVAPPEGNLSSYLASLAQLRALPLTAIYPAHGEPFTDPEAAIDRYVTHRMQRLQQVADTLQGGPISHDALVDRIYGSSLDPTLRSYARDAVQAYLDYLNEQGAV